MQTLRIIDYGSGNLHSAHKAFERAAREAGCDVNIALATRAKDVASADRIVLPGVGAFADCYTGLAAIPDMLDVLAETVQKKSRPFLGICVGMQLMADQGEESGRTDGLGWIAGRVVPITPRDPHLKIPHMGWNTLTVKNDHPLLKDIPLGPDGKHAYFVHSYHMHTASPHAVIAETEYGGPVTAMVGRDTMVGTQFHPEKSQTLGLKLIANFMTWSP